MQQDFYAELPVLIFYFPLYSFHMKNLYKISTCEAKKKKKTQLFVTAIIILFYESNVSCKKFWVI